MNSRESILEIVAWASLVGGIGTGVYQLVVAGSAIGFGLIGAGTVAFAVFRVLVDVSFNLGRIADKLDR